MELEELNRAWTIGLIIGTAIGIIAAIVVMTRMKDQMKPDVKAWERWLYRTIIGIITFLTVGSGGLVIAVWLQVVAANKE